MHIREDIYFQRLHFKKGNIVEHSGRVINYLNSNSTFIVKEYEKSHIKITFDNNYLDEMAGFRKILEDKFYIQYIELKGDSFFFVSYTGYKDIEEYIEKERVQCSLERIK